MRFLAIILLSYFSIIVVSPAVCSSYAALSSMELCASDSECDPNSSEESSSTENPCGECCVMGCCKCDYFITDKEKGNIPIATRNEKKKLRNQNADSSYLSQCWRPPQAA